jgi:metallo-beta-lactamase class B
MSYRIPAFLAATILLPAVGFAQPNAAPAQYAPVVPDWNQPVEPFRIAGNLYYVGASNVGAYLFTTPQGHILLETGFAETVPRIEAGMKKLGFRLEDVRLLLTGHGHYDHSGGLAEIKRRTRARLLTNPAEVELLVRGGKGDFAFGDTYAYPPVQPDGTFRDGEPIRFGGLEIVPHFTPGHTKGCTSYSTTVAEAGRSYRVVFICGLSAPGYQLVNNRQYPSILDDFEKTFAILRALPCDILLATHTPPAELQDRYRSPGEYARYIDRFQAALRNQREAQSGK